ncbi:thioesterase II family protein [Streptomyces beigongshangae]|uniref:thioesterase II family protein n=1 Tax=Streptomyces beigongshangae TaxID=2841597 RepID=UPI001C8436BC|nr:alpha/beta fold hydrolase [Streptomyces sp. REN17]
MSVTSPSSSPYNASDWIRDFHPADPAAPRMICFPHAGGAASYYFPVSRALAGRVEVLAVQYPGRQDRHTEPPLTDVHALAAHAFRELPRDGLDRTWLFGHSMGAAVAFEVALLMEREHGVSPAGLIVSGRRAPSRFRGETVHRQGDEALIASVKALNGTDPSVFADPETRRLVLPTLRADYQAIETYRPAGVPRVACPLFAFLGDADPLTTIDEAEDWRRHTEGPFTLRVFEGNHFYLTPRAGEVVAEISRLIVPPQA